MRVVTVKPVDRTNFWQQDDVAAIVYFYIDQTNKLLLPASN